MTLRHIEIYMAVCQEGSVSKAADRLHISQPTVSVAIKEIEEQYKERLFNRISHRLYITPFGEQIYDYALQIMNLFTEMLSVEHTSVSLSIGTGTAIGKLFMPKVVKNFQQENQSVSVQMSVGDATRMYQKLLDNSLDVVIAETVDDYLGMSYYTIQKYPVVAVCSSDNPLCRKKTVTAQDLAGENLLLRELGSHTRAVVDAYFYSRNISITPMWESYSVQTQINAAKEGLGVSFMSLDQALAVPDTNLSILNIPDFNASRFVNVSYLKYKVLSPITKQFLDFYVHFTGEQFNNNLAEYNRAHKDMPFILKEEYCNI